MKQPNQTIKEIFELRFGVEQIFFRDFLQTYPTPEGVNHTHIQALMMLRFQGPSPMSVISQQLMLEKGSFTPVANKLIQLGLVAKLRSDLDKRVYHLSLTDEGESMAENFAETHHTYIKTLLDRLSDEKRSEFMRSVNNANTIMATLKDLPEKDCMK